MKKRNYFGDFTRWKTKKKDKSWDPGTIEWEFRIHGMKEPEYVWAAYGHDCFDGLAHVVFYEDGKWWYVTGSHCSCYGLEEQWCPEEFDPAIYLAAVEKGKRIVSLSSYIDLGTENEDFDKWLKRATWKEATLK